MKLWNYLKQNRKKITFISSIIFIIYTLYNLFLSKIHYSILETITLLDISLMTIILDLSYIICSIIFIIVVADLIIEIWITEKVRIKKLSLIVILIYTFINVFSAPVQYVIPHTNDNYRYPVSYRLDEFLTYVDFHSIEGEFEGNKNNCKYLYIPILKKIIIFDKEIEIKDFYNEFTIIDNSSDES